MHMNESPLRIQVADLEVEPLLQTQSHRVDRPEVHRDPHRGTGIDDSMNLLDGKDFGQRLGALQLHGGERLPVTSASARVEKLDARESHPHRSVGEVPLVL